MIVNNKTKLVLQGIFPESCVFQPRVIRGPLVTDSARGEVLCSRCGMVVADKVEDITEQRSYTHEKIMITILEPEWLQHYLSMIRDSQQ